MSDSNPVEKSNSKEAVALELARSIAVAECIDSNNPNFRKEILDLYAECLNATSRLREYK